MTFFQADKLQAGYAKKEIIHTLSFTLERNSLTAVLGANGSGKTTLLKALCGILPHQGTCSVDGICLEQLSPKHLAQICSYIPQRSGISIDISAMDVVLMGFNPKLKMLEYPNSRMKSLAADALTLVGLSEHMNQNYMTLSEGQKQLCILARTLAADSKMLLLDEPESALDFQYRYKMLNIIRNWVNEHDRCALTALHDPMLALNFCDRLILLKNGRLLDTLNPRTDTLERMETSLAQIYGSINLQRCTDRQGTSHLIMIKEME